MKFHTSASISTDGWLTAEVRDPGRYGSSWGVHVRGAEQYGDHVFVFCACEDEAHDLCKAINDVYARRKQLLTVNEQTGTAA